MGVFEPELEEAIDTESRDETEEPPHYKVLLHNDDYTTMEFVVQVLMTVFNRSIEESTRIMLKVHREGIGVCGVYPFEVAETKVEAVRSLAREHGYPLRCSMEKE